MAEGAVSYALSAPPLRVLDSNQGRHVNLVRQVLMLRRLVLLSVQHAKQRLRQQAMPCRGPAPVAGDMLGCLALGIVSQGIPIRAAQVGLLGMAPVTVS